MKNDQFFFVILNMIGRIFIKPSPRGEGGRRPDEVSTVFPHRLLQIIFSLILCLSLILPSALAAKNADPDRADIRVSLRRLNLTDAVWMMLEGRYLARCAEGAELLLPAGANVTVFLRNGKLILFPGGISLKKTDPPAAAGRRCRPRHPLQPAAGLLSRRSLPVREG